MSVHINIEMLACYLDDALSEVETAHVEKALRDSELLRTQLNQLMKDRDLGDHSVGAIWRRQRLTCVAREQLGSYLLGVLEAGRKTISGFTCKPSAARSVWRTSRTCRCNKNKTTGR